MALQNRLEISLVAAVSGFRRRPVGIYITLSSLIAASTRGDRQPSQFMTIESGEIGDVLRIVSGKTGISHFRHDAQAAEYLHRARRDVIAPLLGRPVLSLALQHEYIRTARRQVERQGHADWACPSDNDARIPIVRCQNPLPFKLVLPPPAFTAMDKAQIRGAATA
jgi:hypothetical protein